MIAVLQDWEEVGRARVRLTQMGLPGHLVPEKHWDLCLLATLADGLDRNSTVVDLGCSGNYVLDLLAAMGFHDLVGIDLAVPLRARLHQLKRMADERTLRPPYRIKKGDLLQSGLPPASVDLLTCVSVIEHGVDLPRFVAECRRLLRPRGTLFLTTDYWDDAAPGVEDATPFDLPWRGFDRDSIADLVALCQREGLELQTPMEVPAVKDPVVLWLEQRYTFVALTLRPAGAAS